jgi:hypothetical protein
MEFTKIPSVNGNSGGFHHDGVSFDTREKRMQLHRTTAMELLRADAYLMNSIS